MSKIGAAHGGDSHDKASSFMTDTLNKVCYSQHSHMKTYTHVMSVLSILRQINLCTCP